MVPQSNDHAKRPRKEYDIAVKVIEIGCDTQ